jgi:hypothetical protein
MRIQFYCPTAVAKDEPIDNRFHYTQYSYITVTTDEGKSTKYKLPTLLVKALSKVPPVVLIKLLKLWKS